MRELYIRENDAGQRLDRFLSKAIPKLPQSLAQKFIRTKRIKVGGKRSERNYRLAEGDTVQLYIADEYFDAREGRYDHLSSANPHLDLIYEDDNILIINKSPGIVCQPVGAMDTDSLVARVQAYLLVSGQWSPEENLSFTPALCNRIDRNTGGIVLAAKNAPALKTLNEKIRIGQVRKYYLCIVRGTPDPREAVLENFILKDGEKNHVTVLAQNAGNRLTGTVKDIEETKKVTVGQASPVRTKKAITRYRTLSSKENLSLVECEIMTGRSHQIRAQMAAIGHPLSGDRKYGGGFIDGQWQSLWAYKVNFDFSGDSGVLEYLAGRSFAVKSVKFAEKFPDISF